jgi:hypothetical protein
MAAAVRGVAGTLIPAPASRRFRRAWRRPGRPRGTRSPRRGGSSHAACTDRSPARRRAAQARQRAFSSGVGPRCAWIDRGMEPVAGQAADLPHERLWQLIAARRPYHVSIPRVAGTVEGEVETSIPQADLPVGTPGGGLGVAVPLPIIGPETDRTGRTPGSVATAGTLVDGRPIHAGMPSMAIAQTVRHLGWRPYWLMGTSGRSCQRSRMLV